MYKLYALDLFFLMILSNCWSILTSRQATGAVAKCLSVPRALFLTPWWAGSDEQVDVLTFWRFLSPSLPTRDGGWKKSGPPMRFTSVTNYISYSNRPQFELMMFAINFYHCYEHTSYLSFLSHWQDFRKPNFTPKKTNKGTKTLKMSLKKSNIWIFFTQSGKIYTWHKIFKQAPPVVPVANMRYGYEAIFVPGLVQTFIKTLASLLTTIA